ncbi:MAG: M20/M25/M40 family metallo-hydrolase [Halioglobus sp.]
MIRLFAYLLLFINLVPASFANDTGRVSPQMRENAISLIQRAKNDNTGYAVVESLTTEVGPRLAGTEAEARARTWAVNKLTSLGLQNVRIESFQVPLWTRKTEQARIISPYPQALTITALGGSPSTGPTGVTGELVAFDSLAQLAVLKDGALKGKILFINEAMTRTQDGSGYRLAVAKRRESGYQALRLGAKAALIRSVGTSNHRFAHTGQMQRITEEPLPTVPTAALASPDADQIARMLKLDQAIVLHLILETESGSTGTSGNVIAEIPGREHPEQIVLISAHLDSWDLGTGAVDDGAGVGIVVGAAKLLLDNLDQTPKRTIRIVLFGSEEVGLVGAQAYAQEHAEELANHVVATESDFGAGNVWRFDTRLAEEKLPLAEALWEVLRPLGISRGHNTASGGPDMKYIREAGVPVVQLFQNGWDYFDLHHTANDTLDKIDPEQLAQNIAAMAVFTYLAADMEESLR